MSALAESATIWKRTGRSSVSQATNAAWTSYTYRMCQSLTEDADWIQTRCGAFGRSGQRARAESRARRISEMYVPDSARRSARRTISRSSSSRGEELAANRGATLPLEVSSRAAVSLCRGARADFPAPARAMPTAASDAVRRKRLNEPREGGPTSDGRDDAVWWDCEREDLATQQAVLASLRTNDSTIKERPRVRQTLDTKPAVLCGAFCGKRGNDYFAGSRNVKVDPSWSALFTVTSPSIARARSRLI